MPLLSCLLLGAMAAGAAGAQQCMLPTRYKTRSMDGCTTLDHHEAWCYTSNKSRAWRACTAADEACVFPFRYKGTKYFECTTVDAAAPWCYDTAESWHYCENGSGPAPAPPPPPTMGGFGTRSGSAGWVADHNHFRHMHGAGDVAWDDDLAEKAQSWAENLDQKGSMYHSDCYETWPPSGENLAWGYGGCSAATRDGGPRLYEGDYDQHCVVASWYGEYYLWRGQGEWQGADGVGHFTAMVWKGVDAIGCASAGRYYVCEYGSRHCKGHSQYGGQACWAPASGAPHLPNFNSGKCSGGKCVQALFSVPGLLEGERGELPWAGGKRGLRYGGPAACGLVLVLAVAAALATRSWLRRGRGRGCAAAGASCTGRGGDDVELLMLAG